jgi:hypothetical protein
MRGNPCTITILAGDMNPCSSAHNMSHMDTTVRDGSLRSLSSRKYTYCSPATGTRSTLDFIYSNSDSTRCPATDVFAEDIYDSDHVPVIVSTDMAALGFGPIRVADPSYRPPTVKVLEAPSQEQLRSLHDDVVHQHWGVMDRLEADVADPQSTHITETIDTLQAVLDDIQTHTMPKYMRVSSASCSTFKHFPRHMSRKRKMIIQTIQQIRDTPIADRHTMVANIWERFHPAMLFDISPIMTIHEVLTRLRTELDALHRQHKSHCMQAAKARSHMVYKARPKTIHEELKQPGREHTPPLRVLLSATEPGGVAHTPEQVIREVTTHFSTMLEPPTPDSVA